MNNDLMEMFGISLALTIAVESAVAFLLERKRFHIPARGEHGKNMRNIIFLVILVNVLTNPPAVLLCWLGRMYLPDVPRMSIQLVVEIAVVAVEACIYRSFAGKPLWKTDRPVRLAVAANVCSWLVGVIFPL